MGWTELYDMDREMDTHDRAREIAPEAIILDEAERVADWHPNERGMMFIERKRLVALVHKFVASALLAEHDRGYARGQREALEQAAQVALSELSDELGEEIAAAIRDLIMKKEPIR